MSKKSKQSDHHIWRNTLSIKKLDYVHKTNYELFGDKNPVLFVRVKTLVRYHNYETTGLVILNNKILTPITNLFVMNEEEKRFEIIRQFEAIKVISENTKGTDITSHVREDNGADKIAYNTPYRAWNAIWSLMNRYPGKIFQVYTCGICGKYHVGKVQDNETSIPDSTEQ